MENGKRLQVLQPDVPELHFHRSTDVHLETDQPSERTIRRIVIDCLSHQVAVQNVSEHIPAGDDVELIPIVGLDQSLEFVAAAQVGNHSLVARLQASHLTAQGEEMTASLPKFNQLIVLNHGKARPPHCVTPVTPFAREPRYMLVGFAS